MYLEHFGLSSEPFSIAPDPKFLFLSESHNEALAHLLYGFSHGGFVLISGEVGTGKTTLLRNLLDRTPADVDVAFILNPRLTVKELLETLCEELGVAVGAQRPDSVKQYIDLLNRHLLQTHQNGRSTVVVIDEAQNLTPAVLEQIRLLTNLETNERKLLRIILLGQPELADMLERQELRQLSQRITARYHLAPLSRADTHNYVAHRLIKAGGNPTTFTKGAINRLYRLSKGTPRLINIIADRAMLGAFVNGQYSVSARLVSGAAQEVLGGTGQSLLAKYASVVVVLAALMAGVWHWQSQDQGTTVDTRSEQPVRQQMANTPQNTPSEETPPITSQPEPRIEEAIESPINPTTDTATELTIAPSNPDDVTVSRPDMGTYQSQRLAFASVFNRWGTVYDPNSGIIPCDFAPQVGLQCLRRNSGWSELNRLNTPVVMELWDEEENPYYAALVARQGASYTLVLGNTTLTITPRDLRDNWFGSFHLLWQTPPGYTGSLRQGDSHPSVSWLRDRLGSVATNEANYFDANLHTAVTDFQSSQGLLADGVVGPLTWIQLADQPGAQLE